MKYFKYYLWDRDDYKTEFRLHRDDCMYNQIKMPFFGEIRNGKNYDLITGEEIAYCAHPYAGGLSFYGYELTSADNVKFFLKLMKPNDIRDYKNFIASVKKRSSKQSPELAQSMYIRGGELPDYSDIDELVKKMRK